MDELNARQSGSRNPARTEGVPLIGRIKSLEHRTDPIKHMNRATKKSLSSVKHFSIQYPFEAKLAKTQKESLKLCYDER